jgi:two-component system OmpR family sensor kinase
MIRLPGTHSLRARLLWLLIAAITLAAVVQGGLAYRSALSEADQIFDYHMQQMAMSLRSGLPVTVTSPIDGPGEARPGEEFAVQVWTTGGLLVFRSNLRVPLPTRVVLGFANMRAEGGTYRVYSLASSTHVIQIAQDMAVRRRMAGSLALRAVLPIALIGPVLLVIVWWAVGASLAPVARLRRQVALRQPDELGALDETGVPEEIQPLVRETNLLFGRVRRAFEAQTSFVADAAHELRSPLAALRLQAQGLQRAQDDEARALAVTRLLGGIDRATRLVDQLLILARQQASDAHGAKAEALSLADIARLELAEAVPAAQARGIDLGLVRADEVAVWGHREALRILVRNLLDNAVKYTPEGGAVDVAVCRDGRSVVFSVDDSGPGIPEADRARVLDRFYRVPGTAITGSGLGLAIVKAVADLHGATLTLATSPARGGLRASLRLPEHTPAPHA